MSTVAALPNASEPEQPQVPHNIEAEQALLGTLLVNNDVYDRVANLISSAHFCLLYTSPSPRDA